MALTLAQGNEYSCTDMQRAVIDRLVEDSPILARLPFITILGNSLTYDTITTDAGANWYTVNDTWVESTPDVTQATAALKILGGDADIDNFLLKTRSNKIDLKGTVIGNKVKAVQYKFLDTFYYGNDSINTKEFDGLHVLLSNTTYNTVHEGSDGTESVLNLSNLRHGIDLITGFRPNLIVMTKLMRRSLSTYLDSAGDKFQLMQDDFGKFVEAFDGIPIAVDDHITDTEDLSASAYSASTGGTATSIFILSFDEMACCGIHSGDGVQVDPLGELETKDASRWRIKWYVSLMLQDIRSCAKLDGVDPDGVVAA